MRAMAERADILGLLKTEAAPGADLALLAALGEVDAVPLRHHTPSVPVQGHGVGEGAIAIEDEGADVRHRRPLQ